MREGRAQGAADSSHRPVNSPLSTLFWFAACLLGIFGPMLEAEAMAAPQAERQVHDLEPDLEAAVLSAHRAFEQAVFARSPRADATLMLVPQTIGPRIDPVRSVLAAECFLALLHRRGSAAEMHVEDAPRLLAWAGPRVGVSVAHLDRGLVFELADLAETQLIGSPPIRVPFEEHAWVRGAIPRLERFERAVRGQAVAENAAGAREEAAALIREELERCWPELAALDRGRIDELIAEWELDRFESTVGEPRAARCALLVGLSPQQVREVRAEAGRMRYAKFCSWTVKGGAGCLWLAFCVMLCIRADLATRGYLSWMWRGLFTLLFALGVAGAALTR